MALGLSSSTWLASCSWYAGRDYAVLDRPEVQARLHLPADQSFTRPESALERMLYDCPDVLVGPDGVRCRVVVATHAAPANAQKRRVGHTRQGIVYELFFTNLPQEAFMASDVVALYLHRGADLPVLADEDQELDPDRWCSHSPAGQQAWQIVSQWIWNVRLELGHQLEPTEVRTTEFALAVPEAKEQQPASRGYGKPSVAAPWKAGRFSGQNFVLQSDGTVRCPANQFAQLSRLHPCPVHSARIIVSTDLSGSLATRESQQRAR
jgi:hypothetical protein